MGIFDGFLGKRPSYDNWLASHKGMIKEVTYDELVAELGRPTKAKSGHVYWRGPLTDLDPDHPEDQYYQLSNKNYRYGSPDKTPSTNITTWYVLATSEKAIRLLAHEVGGLARNIETA